MTRKAITGVVGAGGASDIIIATNITSCAAPSNEGGCDKKDGLLVLPPPADQDDDEIDNASLVNSMDTWETENRQQICVHQTGERKAELELIKMLKDHKCPLLLQEKAFNWARRNAVTHSVYFSKDNTQKRETIMKDVILNKTKTATKF